MEQKMAKKVEEEKKKQKLVFNYMEEMHDKPIYNSPDEEENVELKQKVLRKLIKFNKEEQLPGKVI